MSYRIETWIREQKDGSMIRGSGHKRDFRSPPEFLEIRVDTGRMRVRVMCLLVTKDNMDRESH